MDSVYTAESLAIGGILAREINYQIAGPTLGPKQRVPPKPVTISAENVQKEDLARLPMCPMIYAIVTDSTKIGDPNVPDWQPQVSSAPNNLSKPALVPLNLSSVSLDVKCQASTGFVTVQGTWVLHCIKQGHNCDCILTVPMHKQGIVTAKNIETRGGKCYTTIVLPRQEGMKYETKTKTGRKNNYNSGIYNPDLFCLTISQVDAGSELSLQMSWFQPMMFVDRTFSVLVPFTFPDYIMATKGSLSKVAKVSCKIESGIQQEAVVVEFSHPMKEISRDPERVTFSINSDEPLPNSDFVASYKVSLEGILPVCLVQEANKPDNKGTFCISIFPPCLQPFQFPRRAVVFLLDRSGSMQGQPMDDACQALLFAISKLHSTDCFNIVAFDHELLIFSSELQNVDDHSIRLARDWIMNNCKARGSTDIFQPLRQAIEMLQNAEGALQHIFLITDGSVSNEKTICQWMQDTLKTQGSTAPRISTFGIGQFCNPYFLKMLALFGHGLSDVALHSGRIKEKMEEMFAASLSPLLTDISLVIADPLQTCEVFPVPIRDLFYGDPLIIFGYFDGDEPPPMKISGVLTNGTAWEGKVQTRKIEHFDIKTVCAHQQMELLVAHSWLYGDQNAKEKATVLSIETGIPCEYTSMIGFGSTKENYKMLLQEQFQRKNIDVKRYTRNAAVMTVRGVGMGFGDVEATSGNISPLIPHSKELDGMLDPLAGYIYGCDCFLCNCCCSCLERNRYSCGATFANCLVYTCQDICAAILCFACINFCVECCCALL